MGFDRTHSTSNDARWPIAERRVEEVKNVFLQKPYLLEWISRCSLCYDARRDQTRCCASESAIDTFSMLSRYLVNAVFLQFTKWLESPSENMPRHNGFRPNAILNANPRVKTCTVPIGPPGRVRFPVARPWFYVFYQPIGSRLWVDRK